MEESKMLVHKAFNIPLPFLHEIDESFTPNPGTTPSSWDLVKQINPNEIILLDWGRHVFDMATVGQEAMVNNLNAYLEEYRRRGYRLILITGEDGLWMRDLEYDLDAEYASGVSNKRVIDVLAGDNHLGINFFKHPALERVTIFREVDLNTPDYERRAIELLDYLRSKGAKACYHNPRWGDYWSIESGSRDRISVFNTHEDYFVMSIYRCLTIVNNALLEGRPQDIYKDVYNTYKLALDFLKSKAGNIPLSNIGSEEDGQFHGKQSGYLDVTPEQAAEAERGMLDAFKDSGCGVIGKWSFFDLESSAWGICASNLTPINDPEWGLPSGKFYPSAEVWKVAFMPTPTPPIIQWWNSLLWWQKALVIAGGIGAAGGAVYGYKKLKRVKPKD
jgi:hypothetical protein